MGDEDFNVKDDGIVLSPEEIKYQLYIEQVRELMEHAGRERLANCHSCGDVYPRLVTKLTGNQCPDCYAEIKFGKVSQTPAKLGFFGEGLSAIPDDTAPSWENAVRLLEDRL